MTDTAESSISLEREPKRSKTKFLVIIVVVLVVAVGVLAYLAAKPKSTAATATTTATATKITSGEYNVGVNYGKQLKAGHVSASATVRHDCSQAGNDRDGTSNAAQFINGCESVYGISVPDNQAEDQCASCDGSGSGPNSAPSGTDASPVATTPTITSQEAYQAGYTRGKLAISGFDSGGPSEQSVCDTNVPSEYSSAGLGGEWQTGCAAGFANGPNGNLSTGP